MLWQNIEILDICVIFEMHLSELLVQVAEQVIWDVLQRNVQLLFFVV